MSGFAVLYILGLVGLVNVFLLAVPRQSLWSDGGY
jgi:hypothetical protein